MSKRCCGKMMIRMCGAMIVLAAVFAMPAQAQFVCSGSPDGSETQNGGGATALGSANMACGPNANASGVSLAENTAFGFSADAHGNSAVNTAIGVHADAHGNGSHNTATGASAAAFGDTGNNTAVGFNANASGNGSVNTVLGANADADGSASFNTAIGAGALAAGDNSGNIATGHFSFANGNNSHNTAIGDHANASGTSANNTAYGANSDASGSLGFNTATGSQADAHGTGFNTATGTFSKAFGNFSNNTAMGAEADASGDGSHNTAIGINADAHGNGTSNTAVGANSVAANNSSAFGAGAQAPFVNSAAFGNGATATRANQQVLGTAGNTYTLPGLTSVASRAAQNGPTQVVTTDAFGNLGITAPSALGLGSATDVTALAANVDRLNRHLAKANTGLAMSFAMAGIPTVLPNEKLALALRWGTFQGENGAALNGAVRIRGNMQLNAAFAYGFRENIVSGSAGLRFGF